MVVLGMQLKLIYWLRKCMSSNNVTEYEREEVKTVKVESPGALKIQEPWARGCFCPSQLRSSTLEVWLECEWLFCQ